jgi:proline dehydrogenase
MAKSNNHIPFCVFKVTGLARFALLEKISSVEKLDPNEKEEWERVKNRVAKICSTAAEAHQPIFIDAEESWIQQAIDDLANENMKSFNKNEVIVYNTFQLYRKDRLAFLMKSFNEAKNGNYKIGAKLVRGAYMEKERARAIEKKYSSPIQNSKEDSDKDYDLALKYCVENIEFISVCAGSHNEKSSLYLVQLMNEKGIEKNDKRIFFSQLLGMSDHISYNLSLNGYNVSKYVPYGPVKEVLPYLIRRAQENTSVKGQTGRELSLIIKEKQRRKGL